MKTMLARMAIDAHIRESRPFAIFASILCLVIVGVLLILISIPLLLMGAFAHHFFLTICGGLVAIGLLCILLSWGLYRGIYWTWYSTALLAPLLTFAVWYVMMKVDSITFFVAGSIVVLLAIAQLVIWMGPVRRWFFSSHEIRSYVRDLEFLAGSGESSEFSEKKAEQLFDYLYSKRTGRGPDLSPHSQIARRTTRTMPRSTFEDR